MKSLQVRPWVSAFLGGIVMYVWLVFFEELIPMVIRNPETAGTLINGKNWLVIAAIAAGIFLIQYEAKQKETRHQEEQAEKTRQLGVAQRELAIAEGRFLRQMKHLEQKLLLTQEEEERYATLFFHTFDGVVMAETSPDHAVYRVVDVNDPFTAMVRKTREELQNKPLEEVCSLLEFEGKSFRSLILAGEVTEFVAKLQNLPRYYRVRTAIPGYGRFAVILHDVTDFVLAEQKLRQQNEHLLVLYETALAIVQRVDMSQLLWDIAGKVSELIRCPNVAIAVMDQDGTCMRTVVNMGTYRELAGVPMRREEGLVGQVWQKDQIVMTSDYGRWEHRLSYSSLDKIKASVGVPLHSDGKVVGVFALAWEEEKNAFSQEEIQSLDRFAQLASLILDNARLYLSLQQELEERRKNEDRIWHLACHDADTGMPNQYFLREKLGEFFRSGPEKKKNSLVLLILAVGSIGQISELIGHHAGDAIMEKLGRWVEEHLPEGGVFAKLRGDELGILIEEAEGDPEMRDWVKQLMTVCEQPWTIEGKIFFLPIYIGSAVAEVDRENANELWHQAELALREGRRRGETYCLYTPEILGAEKKRVLLRDQLGKAVAHEELRLFYQPRLNIITQRVASLEALIYWDHPDRGLLDLREVLEETQEDVASVSITHWGLGEACRQLKIWRTRGWEIVVGVKVPAVQLLQMEFSQTVRSICRETSVDPAWLTLEVSGSICPEQLGVAANVLEDLHSMGIGVFLEERNIGTALMTGMKKLSFDGIKVRKTFFLQAQKSPADLLILEGIGELGRLFCFNVIGEGIETERQYDLVRHYGFVECQGSFCGRPLLPEEIFAQYGEKKKS